MLTGFCVVITSLSTRVQVTLTGVYIIILLYIIHWVVFSGTDNQARWYRGVNPGGEGAIPNKILGRLYLFTPPPNDATNTKMYRFACKLACKICRGHSLWTHPPPALRKLRFLHRAPPNKFELTVLFADRQLPHRHSVNYALFVPITQSFYHCRVN